MIPLKKSRRITAVLLFLICIVMTGNLQAQSSHERDELTYGDKLFKDQLYDLAARQYAQFAEKYPYSPDGPLALFRVGECYRLLQQYENAREHYFSVLIRYDKSEYDDTAQFRIGQCEEALDNHEAALSAYYRMIQFYPKSQHLGEALLSGAKLAARTGNDQEALRYAILLKENAVNSKDYAEAVLIVAELSAREGNSRQAISHLEPLLKSVDSGTQKAQVNLKLGEYSSDLGLWQQAIDYYNSVITAAVNRDMTQQAWTHSAQIFEMMGRDADAASAYDKALEIQGTESGSQHAHFRAGLLAMNAGEYKRAIEHLSTAAQIEAAAASEPRYYLAMAVAKEGRTEDAMEILEAILKEKAASKLYKQSLLQLAQLKLVAKRYNDAIILYEEYIQNYPEDALQAWVRIKMAETVFNYGNRWEAGFGALRDIWKRKSAQPVLEASHFIYALGLRRAGRLSEARFECDYMMKSFPLSEWADETEALAKTLSLQRPQEISSGTAELTALLKTVIENGTPEREYQLGMISYTVMKDFQSALQHFSNISGSTAGEALLDSALFMQGACHGALQRLENLPDAWRNAVSAYGRIEARSQIPDLRESAAYRSVMLQAEFGNDPAGALESYLQRYSHPEHTPLVLAKLAVLNKNAGQAETVLTRLITDYADFHTHEKGLLTLISLKVGEGDWAAVDSLVSAYASAYSGEYAERMADSFRVRALLAQRRPFSDWIRVDKLLQFTKFSPMGDSLRLRAAEYLLESKQFDQAVEYFSEGLQEDSLKQWGVQAGLLKSRPSMRKVYLEGLAGAYRGLRMNREAKKAYFQYGLICSPSERNTPIRALAAIAEEEKDFQNAIALISEIKSNMRPDSAYAVLGRLYMKAGEYGNAVSQFDRGAADSQSDSMRAWFTSRSIVALYQQDKIPQAEVQRDVFEKTFRRKIDADDYIAEIWLAQGKAHFSNKDFTPALEAFDQVIRKYKRTRFARDAEFEKGRTLMVLNRIEDALNILIGMISKYPDDPVLNKVYLNLGVHYYRSQQFDNAINAFKFIIEDSVDVSMRQVALQQIIDVYDGTRMYDAAMASLRRYIREYPNAVDHLSKRIKIGTLYMKMNEYSRAIEYLREVKKEADSESEAEIQYWIGESYFSMGLFNEAIFEFLKVKYMSKPTKLPWGTSALYKAALAYMKVEKEEQAKKLFTKIVQSEGAASDLGRFAQNKITEIDQMKGVRQ